MKKLLTLALVALSAAAAQAVTWTGSTSSITAEVTSLDSTTLASSKDSSSRTAITAIGGTADHQAQTFVVGIVFDGSAAGDIIRYSHFYTYDSNLSMGLSTSGLVAYGNSNITATYAEGMDASSISKLITSGSNTLVTQVVVTPTTEGTNIATTVTYYLNGELIGTTTRSGGYKINAFYLGDAVSAVYYTSGPTYDAATQADPYTEEEVAEMTAAQVAAAAAMTDVLITNLVPEPTVLALLALGVAGIALKRKVV